MVLVTGNALAQSRKVTLPSDSVLKSLMNEYRIPALAIGVIEGEMVTQTKVLGELKKGVRAPEQAIFQVASLTKPITVMTTLRLVSQGLWDLDEPLARYWTDPDVRDDPNSRKLTTRHVVSHQTGFVNWRWLHPTGKLTFDFEPGTQTGYSGEGLEYLKKALEEKFQMPFEKLVSQYLFEPDGMKDTRFFWDNSMNETHYAVAHTKEGKPYEIKKNKEASAADLLMTTIRDYAVFGSQVLKKKNISDAVWQDMVTIQAPSQNSRFGLGWEVFNDLAHGEFALIHAGSDPGVRTIIILLPKSERGLVIFTNSDSGMEIIKAIIAVSLDTGPELLRKAG